MKYLSIIIISVILAGCAALGIAPPPSVCDQPGSEKSLICSVCEDMGTTPEAADLILQAAALRSLDDHDKGAVLRFYGEVESFLSVSVSYTALINYVQNYVDMTGPELMIVSLYFPRLQSTQIISQFDRNLLLSHIDNMRTQLK